MEKKKSREQDAEIEEAQVEQLRRQQRVETGQEGQGDSTREDWNIEVQEEGENKKKLDEQRRRLQKQIREIEKFTDMDQMFPDSQKEKWKERQLEIEEKRNELLPGTPEDAEEVSKDAEYPGQEEKFAQGGRCV